jgi:aspartate aminotransferase
MLDNLKPQAADKILALIQMFKDDPRDGKIDLGDTGDACGQGC